MGGQELSSKLQREDILGIDIATQTGYYSIAESGAWNFIESRVRNDNKKHKAFRDTIMGFVKEHNIKQIVAEGVNVNTHFTAVKSLSELHGILLEVCDELDLPEPEYVNPMTLKKFATGNGKANKLDMISACRTRYNFNPRTDDEADAFWLHKYYCHKHRIF